MYDEMTEELLYRPSNISRRAACPGSAEAEKGIEEKKTEAALSGDRVHDALKCHFSSFNTEYGHDEITCLDERETGVYQRFSNRVEEVIKGYVRTPSIHPEINIDHPVHGGTIDLLVEFMGNCGLALIFDYKTFWGEHSPAWNNLQMMTYVHNVFWKNQDIMEIHAYMFSAGNKETPVETMTVYKRSDFAAISSRLEDIVTESSRPGAKRIPSVEACKYCKAFGNPNKCQESLKCDVNMKDVEKLKKLTITPKIAEEIKDTYNKLKLAEKAKTALGDWMRDQLGYDENAFHGYVSMREGNKRKVENKDISKSEIYRVLYSAELITMDQFDEQCRPNIKALIDQASENLAARDGLTDSKSKEKVMRILLDNGIMSIKRNRPTLQVKK